MELYITAVDRHTGELRVFGKDRADSILDAIMPSSALPIVFAPWQYKGRQYVDGGVVSDLPMRVAVEVGATELYAIDIGPLQFASRTTRGVLRVVGQTIDAVVIAPVGERAWVVEGYAQGRDSLYRGRRIRKGSAVGFQVHC